MKFIVHDAEGNILRTGQCPADHLAMQAKEGEFVIEGIANDAAHRIENGAIVAKEVEIVATPYQALRARAYPPISDYIDGIVKGDQNQINTYIAACQAVKTQFPKG